MYIFYFVRIIAFYKRVIPCLINATFAMTMSKKIKILYIKDLVVHCHCAHFHFQKHFG